MKLKKFFSILLAGIFLLGSFGISQAATRDEIFSVKVSKSGNFKYWSENSAAKKKLVEYVKDITNKKSKNFIPVEDRIAVFDLDGTLICETAPCYFEWMMYLQRALYDENFTPSKEDRDYAKIVESEIRAGHFPTGKFPKDMDLKQAQSQFSVFKGMTDSEFNDYVKNFMETPVEGMTNLKWGESFYLPMVEVIRYLQANDFTVFIVSGTDRMILRTLAGDVLKVKSDNIIGSDRQVLASHQNGVDSGNYTYKTDDYVIRGELMTKNLKMNKVSAIEREIGKQPVLAFGNSGGDSSMLNFTAHGNKYKSLSFMVLCDDLDREFGSMSKAENCKKLSETNGWISISMKNDFKTIYGDNVKKN